MLLANTAAAVVFSLVNNIFLLYSTRLIIGITQSFCVIYSPVWINEFSPSTSNTKWMAMLHASVVFGIMFGYLVAGMINNFFSDYLSWRFAIQIQAFIEAIVAVCFYFTDPACLDIINKKKIPDEVLSVVSHESEKDKSEISSKIEESQESPKKKKGLVRMDTINFKQIGFYLAEFKDLLNNSIFVFMTLSLMSLYFVVTGI
jgi:MFS family permease